jgi:hypothetical protein
LRRWRPGVTLARDAVSVIPVLLDRYATDEEVTKVRAVFERAGREAMVRPVWEKKPHTGNGAFWTVLVLLGVSFKSFADGFFGKFGEDAAVAFREFVDELRQARRTSTLADDGWFEFDDVEESNVMLASGLPDEAYRALLNLDWETARGGMLMWDSHEREWFDPNRQPARGL